MQVIPNNNPILSNYLIERELSNEWDSMLKELRKFHSVDPYSPLKNIKPEKPMGEYYDIKTSSHT